MNIRHKVEIFILFWLVFGALVARDSYYVHWTVIAILWGVPCLFDWLFLGEDQFLFEPNYKNWQKASETRY